MTGKIKQPLDVYEESIIRRFAKGDNSRREEAITIHRSNLQRNGLQRGNSYFDFMSKVDNDCPDLLLRSHYRRLVLKN